MYLLYVLVSEGQSSPNQVIKNEQCGKVGGMGSNPFHNEIQIKSQQRGPIFNNPFLQKSGGKADSDESMRSCNGSGSGSGTGSGTSSQEAANQVLHLSKHLSKTMVISDTDGQNCAQNKNVKTFAET